MENGNGAKAPTLDLADFDAVDEAEMEVLANGQGSGWVWKFAGPGHPQAAAQSNRVAREQLAKQRMQEQARVNGKKYKSPEQTPDELLEDNVSFVMERLLGWSTITMNGEPFPFTQANARTLLMDRRKGALLQQAVEFILDENSFTRRSVKTSQTSPSATST